MSKPNPKATAVVEAWVRAGKKVTKAEYEVAAKETGLLPTTLRSMKSRTKREIGIEIAKTPPKPRRQAHPSTDAIADASERLEQADVGEDEGLAFALKVMRSEDAEMKDRLSAADKLAKFIDLLRRRYGVGQAQTNVAIQINFEKFSVDQWRALYTELRKPENESVRMDVWMLLKDEARRKQW